jgi:hypothetical protein
VRRNLIPSLANIHLDYSCSVDGKPFVRVDNNAEEARIGVNKFGLKSDFQVVEDRSIIEERQVGHVFTFFKFGWIDLSNLCRWKNFFL